MLVLIAMLLSPAPERLAEALADADSVDAVQVEAHVVTFAIDKAGEAYEIVAHTDARGDVDSVTVRDTGRGSPHLGPLSWLADAMQSTTAIVRLEVDAEGHVTLVADDGTRYLAIPGRGTNTTVEARWGGEWNNS